MTTPPVAVPMADGAFTYGRWFRRRRIDMQWLAHSPVGRQSRCDRIWSHLVAADRPRLRVDDQSGPVRRRGKGKRHSYLCEACALAEYGLTTPHHVNQPSLFEESP